ncbi:vasculin-like protein 1 isoform X2 [Haliotis rufescens]|uniref:vasculin-like protein 1 isoform X2 n=1 Tax=Haliotis rufescens TaxID=6454 RepID=UPI001EAFE0B4|nr:vasculin-like protein 1 isoform X2 [Haliotis rufescens]
MAAHNAPKNDFAPAWLKIPAQENPKSSGSKHSEHMSDKANRPRREENYHNSFNRYGPDYARLHRQHSFDNYFESGKRYPPGQGKYRHHSVDDEFYPYPYGHYGYYNGYSGYDKFGMQYSSQPSLFRPPRDGKYQHPNTRFGQPDPVFFQQLNGGYPPGYYDLYPYDYYPGEPPYYPGYPPHPNKRSYYNKESRSNSKESKEKEGADKKEKEGEKEPPFSDDFPSLNGSEDTTESKTTKSPSGGGVWDNRPINKSGKGDDGDYMFRDGRSHGGSNIYKSLIPKGTIVRKNPREGARVNGGYKDQSPLASMKPMSPTLAQSGKEGSRQSPTPPADLLNTRFVTQPKNLGDKKSNFLKTLRSDKALQENGIAGHEIQENGDSAGKSSSDQLVNGMDELQVSTEPGRNILSSSLEAEQRLLREMGWNEQDEEEYVITEDDMKEFQKLTDMVKKTPRNGLARTLPKTWSPKHIPIYQLANTQELNETLSSSDSETEDDS